MEQSPLSSWGFVQLGGAWAEAARSVVSASGLPWKWVCLCGVDDFCIWNRNGGIRSGGALDVSPQICQLPATRLSPASSSPPVPEALRPGFP